MRCDNPFGGFAEAGGATAIGVARAKYLGNMDLTFSSSWPASTRICAHTRDVRSPACDKLLRTCRRGTAMQSKSILESLHTEYTAASKSPRRRWHHTKLARLCYRYAAATGRTRPRKASSFGPAKALWSAVGMHACRSQAQFKIRMVSIHQGCACVALAGASARCSDPADGHARGCGWPQGCAKRTRSAPPAARLRQCRWTAM